MRRWHAIALIGTLASIALFAILHNHFKPEKDNRQIRIGAILPLTGTASNYGEMMERGIRIALEEIADDPKLSKSNIKIVIEDSRSSPKDGVAAFQKLVTIDETPAVMPALSGIILGCVPIAEQNGITLLNCPANSPKLRGAGKHVFNLYPLSDQESKSLAKYAYGNMNARSAAVVYVDNDSGRGYRDSFASEFANLGGTVTLSESHQQGTSDFRATVEKLRGAAVDLVFICSYYAESARLLKQSDELEYRPKWLSYSSVETPDFLKIVGSSAEGLVYSQPGFDVESKDPATRRFVEKYKNKYQEDPDIWGAQFYDGTMLLASAIASGARTGEDISNYLSNLNDAPSSCGPVTFDQQGCISRKINFKVVKSGKFHAAR